MTNQSNLGFLRLLIVVLALGDGVLHFLLDFVLFRGVIFGSPFQGGAPGRAPRPPAGGPPRGANPLSLIPIPLNELFLLNLVGEVVLVVLFLYSRRLLGDRRWIVDVGMILFAAATFVGWWVSGRPNPMMLGYLSKTIEIVLIVALGVDIWSIFRPRAVATAAAQS